MFDRSGLAVSKLYIHLQFSDLMRLLPLSVLPERLLRAAAGRP
jgi:hypothetical protein